MKAIITPKYYFDPLIHKAEEDKIFKNHWTFVGFTFDVSQDKDFITQRVGNIPIVVQNFNGVLRCFKNICSHRFSIIQTEKKGNRALMCPYHGWSYSKDGLPVGIPKKPLFKFTDSELECLKLKEYNVSTCGNLIFVNLSHNKITLQEYLGQYFTEIAQLTNAFGELIDTNQITIKANWKIIVENTLESYHVNLIHKDSFRKLGASGMNFDFQKYHSTWDASIKFQEDDPALKLIHKPYIERPYKISGYKHILLFPNILISTTYGISFNLSHILPIDAEKTLFTSYVFITSKNIEKKKTALETEYENSLVEFNKTVFDEDKYICEQVQIGVNYTDYNGELSDEEMRVCEFQKQYIQSLT